MNIEDVRQRALAEIERNERRFKAAFLLACTFEAAMLAALLLAMDPSNRTHLLLVVGFVGSYTVVVLAIVALGIHVSRIGRRVLHAIELASRH